MDNIGAEVGQKMRSAIKAKLQELGCYVDDELPDYIMVMVANKRTESQMKEDLKLFLTTKTSAFVDWLQIVLKKLKEVTVTNPEVYKKVAKRKSDDKPTTEVKVKKEKREKSKSSKKIKKEQSPKQLTVEVSQIKSLTDDLPIEANKLSKKRKIVVIDEKTNVSDTVNEDVFDIPPLSAVSTSNENELVEVENKIKSVKSRLGLHVQSESEDEDFLTLKAEPEDLFPSEQTNTKTTENTKTSRKINIIKENHDTTSLPLQNPLSESQSDSGTAQNEKAKHTRITFETNASNGSPKKRSVYERLGKRNKDETADENRNNLSTTPVKRTKINISEIRKEEEELLGSWKNKSNKENNQKEPENTHEPENNDITGNTKQRESVLKRLGVKSKVLVPEKQLQQQSQAEEEQEVVSKEVPSAIKVKPRMLPPSASQPNKNLLLKAVAEAQRSIAQTPIVGNNLSPKTLLANRNRNAGNEDNIQRKLSDAEKSKIRNILIQVDKVERTDAYSSDDDNLEYVPKPVKRVLKSGKEIEYIPTYKDTMKDDEKCSTKTTVNQKFVITLDGIDKTKFKEIKTLRNSEALVDVDVASESPVNRKNSPIIFRDNSRSDIPDKLPVIYPPSSLKTKERCKYWPACNKGEKCEYIHPSTTCKNFPRCKFSDKCLYIHPPCKFDMSCTKKDCPFSHIPKSYLAGGPFLPSQLQQCKFFPNCSNPHCTFYHPRPCKFGRFCKNKAECNFFHSLLPMKRNLSWRSES